MGVHPLKDAREPFGHSRILLLSYHFPPAESAGALRWQKLAGLLADRGWDLDVITNDHREVTTSGLQSLEDLPDSTRVVAVPEGRAFTRKYSKVVSRRLKSLRRGRSSQPEGSAVSAGPAGRPGSLHRTEISWRGGDERLRRAYGAAYRLTLDRGWVVAAERCGQAMISEPGVRYRAIVTCGPPHLVHLAGLHLLRQFGIPFVMDLRDPWRFVERLPESIASPVWLRCAQMLEDRCVREASLVISNTEAASELLKRTYPAHGPFIWVRNGSDEIRPAPPRTDRQFLVAFAGSIYLDRDPRPLFEASARVIRERQLEPDGFRLVLVGNTSEFDGRPVSALAEEAGIGEYVDILSSVSRDELVHILERASILVSLPQDSDLAIPSKIYEYAEYPAWLLAISDATSATGALLEGSEADLVPPGSTDAIHRALDRRYGQFARGETPSSLAEDSRFRRSAQADRLVEALESVTPGAE